MEPGKRIVRYPHPALRHPAQPVRAMAEESGYPMPSFFGYLLYSGLILLPVFGVMTWLFFWA